MLEEGDMVRLGSGMVRLMVRQLALPAALLCAALLAGGCVPGPTAAPSKLALARAALSAGNVQRSQQLARDISPDDPDWVPAQLLLAEIAVERQDLHAALNYYQAVPRDASPHSLQAAASVARIQQSRGKLYDAIQAYQYVLQHRPQDNALKGQLAKLYAVTGQRCLTDQLLSEAMQVNDMDFKELVLLTDFERRDPHEAAYLRQCAQSFPDDPAVNLGLAAEEFSKAEYASARRRVERVLSQAPELAAAHGLLGELLLEEGDAALADWHARLPESVRSSPEVWFAHGLWAQRRGDFEMAARCHWEAARRVPTSHRMVHQLGLVMARIDPAIGEAYLNHAQTIYEMRHHLSRALNTKGKEEAAMRRVVALLLDLGREWEAWHWAVFAYKLYDRAPWVPPILERLRKYPDATAPRIQEAANLFRRYDLSHLPSPYESVPGPGRYWNESSAARDSLWTRGDSTHGIRFEDQAAAVGLHFQYHAGRIADNAGVRMQESTGGGIAVLDYDGDGFPDLFLTQGEDWPLETDVPSGSARYRDRLFRNDGRSFHDVTEAAALPPEDGFGQGCAAGDFNNDGFPDLYVANIGPNQLLINNGDGTFQEAASALQLAKHAWTSSCVMADFNGDAHPDLFDANYLEGKLLYRKICDEHSCTPQAHQSAPDHLYLSQGDGTLRSFNLRGEERWGAGLGVVAFRDEPVLGAPSADQRADGHASPAARLHLFVANDHEPNFFLVNSPGEPPANLALTDMALLRGLALNKDGRPTACMGVAAGDVNGDGLLDLFVTNYKEEANNLYLQSAGGYFSDAISGTGLLEPGVPYVGWGAQFLDAENDGLLDLLVANGHVGDFRLEGIECYMPTQFFHHQENGRFIELPPSLVGPYFSRKLLGRTVATLDWNRDGLVDAALLPIAAPAALLTNRSSRAGHFVALRLHAVETARDALGTLVTVTTASGQVRRQLTAGDGYQATNERVLRFGLGQASSLARIDIEWPSGRVQSIESAPVDALLVVIEGRGHHVLSSPKRTD
jgi:tetratricopeptide (TPR) repeat protein